MKNMLMADFSNAKVGDKVKCIVLGEGKINKIDDYGQCPIKVDFGKNGTRYYTIQGRSYNQFNPMLFYHFDGQFPTAEACTRPKPDPYEIHKITREEVRKYADAVELINCCEVIELRWNEKGFAYFLDNTLQGHYVLALDHFYRRENQGIPIILEKK